MPHYTSGLRRWCALAGAMFAALALTACGGAGEGARPVATLEPFGHVHGLGVNPVDEALFIATHVGLFRVEKGAAGARRVGESRQDTMGFTVVSPHTFLASGHPDARDDAPPHLGLLVSNDAGRSWRDLSLRGQADLHVIRVGRRLTYGFDALSGRLFVSQDAADTWRVARPPAPLIDLAVDPEDDRHLLAATAAGVYRSRDGGADWRRAPSAPPGLLAWHRPRGNVLLLFADDGTVRRSSDKGRTWRRIGNVDGAPTAATIHGRDLYVATDDGAIRRSTDGGRTWVVRLRSSA